MWSAGRDRDVEVDDETTDILDSVKERCIDILQGIQNYLGTHGGEAILTLTHKITLQRLRAPIGTIPIMLNTSIQNLRPFMEGAQHHSVIDR